MDAAGMLKRVAMIGLTAAGLAVGSTLTQPTATANASVLPDSHVGAPDVGYPFGGCGSGCGGMDVVSPLPPALASVLPDSHVGSPDVGYPISHPDGCASACKAQSTQPDSHVGAPDVGYPNCPTCSTQAQSIPQRDDTSAWD